MITIHWHHLVPILSKEFPLEEETQPIHPVFTFLLATHSQSNRGNAFSEGRVMEIIKMIISYIWFIHHHLILFTYLPFSYIASSVITPSLLYYLLLPCHIPSLYSPYERQPLFQYSMHFPLYFPPFASD